MRIFFDHEQRSTLADPAHFTGRVWRTDYIAPVDDESMSGSRFLYEPAARSFWHVHEHEQAIIAVHGAGVVAWEGLDVPQRLAPGDWWHVQPGIAHWHGASIETSFAHLAVTAGGATSWLHEVTDEEYQLSAAF